MNEISFASVCEATHLLVWASSGPCLASNLLCSHYSPLSLARHSTQSDSRLRHWSERLWTYWACPLMGWLQTSYPRVPLGSAATVKLFTSFCSLCLICFPPFSLFCTLLHFPPSFDQGSDKSHQLNVSQIILSLCDICNIDWDVCPH